MPRKLQPSNVIPLSRTVEDDTVVWMGDNTGEYSVRGGYRSLINNYNTDENLLQHTEIYKKKLWLLNTPTKSKITIWRMMKILSLLPKYYITDELLPLQSVRDVDCTQNQYYMSFWNVALQMRCGVNWA